MVLVYFARNINSQMLVFQPINQLLYILHFFEGYALSFTPKKLE